MRVMGTRLWKQCLKFFRSWRAAKARRQLLELSDRTLKDIGLKRGEIDSLFR